MLSICLTVKNRSRLQVNGHTLHLLPNCLKSVSSSVPKGMECELVITDWKSDDWPLNEWLDHTVTGLPVKHVMLEGDHFSRGRGLNEAAKAAKGDVLFFVDADSLLNADVIRNGLRYVQEGRAYFPICYSFSDPDHRTGWWRDAGYGNCMVSRSMFETVKGWPEYYKWGKEDDDFKDRLSENYEIAREEVPGFYHQWHPNELAWKDVYAERTEEEEDHFQNIRRATNEITMHIPPGETIILADEAQFGRDPIHARKVLPFLEHEGDYWGTPPDDETAIRELERMRDMGAGSLIFTWIAFWWMDHYTEFSRYLTSHYPLRFENEHLRIYDLQNP